MTSLLIPTVPIIDSVEVAVLSLFEVELNISLLTNGGQSVTQYTVSWLIVLETCERCMYILVCWNSICTGLVFCIFLHGFFLWITEADHKMYTSLYCRLR